MCLIQFQSLLICLNLLMAYAKTTLKTNSSKASPFFQNTLNRECIRQMNACPDFSCEHILINLIRFMVYENAAPSLPPY